jgi:hypothetical protein
VNLKKRTTVADKVDALIVDGSLVGICSVAQNITRHYRASDKAKNVFHEM